LRQWHELMRREDVDELIVGMAGVVLTHLSGMSARCSDLQQLLKDMSGLRVAA
jgi:hypothetical protein